MDAFAVGAVVVISLPYADFSKFKKRPAFVAGKADFDNLILCQITSDSDASEKAIAIDDCDFTKGGLLQRSYIRPDKIFTVEQSIVLSNIGYLSKDKTKAVLFDIRSIFN